jgi:hypothetical protein
MVVIRAHFDGSVIVPDEPVSLPPQAQVVVLTDSFGASSIDELEKATREYYCGLSGDEGASDDDGWGEGLARDSHLAWED